MNRYRLSTLIFLEFMIVIDHESLSIIDSDFLEFMIVIDHESLSIIDSDFSRIHDCYRS